MIRKMEKGDIAACADILSAVYNNELWQCRWTRISSFLFIRKKYKKEDFYDL